MKRVFTIPSSTHGPGPVFFSWQSSSGNYLVTTGYDHMVNIYDRHGERLDQIMLPGMCSGLSWDKDGDVLSVISDASPVLILYDSNTQKVSQVDSGLRDTLTFVLWSKSSPLLAVGTTKGNLLIYNHRTSRKVPVLSKHSKQITCGAWSEQNYIALIGNDKVLTVSNVDGDTLCQTNLKADLSLIQFSSMKQDDRSGAENTVSLILNKKSLYLLNIHNPENPIVLAFQEKYGSVVEYKWYGDGYILLAFSNGYFIVISTHIKEIGQELFQINCHKKQLVHMAACLPQNKVASCGDNVIKIYDLMDMKDVLCVITVDDERSLDWMEWTDDGQLLAVSGTDGNLHVYLTSLPVLGDTHITKLALLTSLLEVTIMDITKKESSVVLKIDIEPTFLAIGPYHLAVGMNNRAWFYCLTDRVPIPLQDREYLGSVQSIKISDEYASALIEGKLQLHIIDSESVEGEVKESKLFPDDDNSNIRITCHALTNNFLIYGTDTGTLQFFFVNDWKIINDYQHIAGIKKIFADPTGTRVLFIDSKIDSFVYNPVDDHLVQLPGFLVTIKGVIWDASVSSKDMFVTYDENEVDVYVYVRDTVRGPTVDIITRVKISSGQCPLLLYEGELTCQTQSGKITNMVLVGQQYDKVKELPKQEQKLLLEQFILLRRYNKAWGVCQVLDDQDSWLLLGSRALNDLNVDFAIKVYRHIEDVSMVWALKSIKEIEDHSLLSGYIAMYQSHFLFAEDLFLKSSKPSLALDMRKMLLQWDLALKLAEKLAPEEIPSISKEYAQQLEFMGDYANALLHYERGIINDDTAADHNNICNAGIARMSIRCSDLQRGISLAMRLNNQTVKKECAEILESMKQITDAAHLYENGGFYDKAASLYVKLKNWDKVKNLLPNVGSLKIHSQYAKAKEADGYFIEAVQAFETARDYDNVIRIYLDNLNNLDAAVTLVKQTKSVEGAKMVARFFQRIGDISSAVSFLVMSKCNDEAFQLAQSASKMNVFAEAVGDDASVEEYNSIAMYYENNKNFLMAGKFYIRAQQPKKAVRLLLQVSGPGSNEALQLAIEAVGIAADEQLTRQVIEFLMGEVDGIPKDFKYLFRLYMGLKQYKEAGKTAVIIAREEQNAGNYRNAHDVLFTMYQELKKHNIKVPSEMLSSLMLLHSYVLVKIHARHGNHMNSARLLIRIANNISKFPSHVVQILTSTVIECHRAGLKNSSFTFAAMLMRPEYRNKIDEKYKKKIEGIVRKPQKTEIEEETSPCPYCHFMLKQSELNCVDCRNNLPFCIVTGYHITKDNLTTCPECGFLAIFSEFSKFLESESMCPMCSAKISSDVIKKINDPQLLLYPETEE